MYFRLMGKLSARRKAILNGDEKEQGFTLIELLVVVVIIGILAAIAIPIYIGIQNGAKDSSAKSDLVNMKTALVAAYTNGVATFPTGPLLPTTLTNGTGSATFGSYGATNGKLIGNGVVVVSGGWTDFCIAVTNTDTTNSFSVSANGSVVPNLTCAGS